MSNWQSLMALVTECMSACQQTDCPSNLVTITTPKQSLNWAHHHKMSDFH